MIILYVGGASSGKSELAETRAMELGSRRLYLATMRPFDDECLHKIEQHRRVRRGKGFDTLELDEGDSFSNFVQNNMDLLVTYDVLLLECVSNLIANTDAEISDMYGLFKAIEHIVIVSNDTFRSGTNYSQSTDGFMKRLGKMNIGIARHADMVYEVVSGKGNIVWKNAVDAGRI